MNGLLLSVRTWARRAIAAQHRRGRFPLLPAAITIAAAVLAGWSAGPKPDLAALGRWVEQLIDLPTEGLVWAMAIGGAAAWTARVAQGFAGARRADGARVLVLAALVGPLLLPCGGPIGFAPALLLALGRADAADRRTAALIAAGLGATLVDARLAPAGAVAMLAAARLLLAAIARVPANDNQPGWRAPSVAIVR